jgi:hypothetical protein
MSRRSWSLALALVAISIFAGCRSPYYGDRGALLGGATGAAIGAAVGEDSGNAVPAAILGAGIGAITGGAIGDGIDADLAQSRAEVEARMGRQMSGAVTPQDAIAMTAAGLSEDVIATHIRANGVAQAPGVNDLIYLRNQGVSDHVIQALQQTPPRGAGTVYAAAPPPGVPVVVEHHYGYGPHYPPPYGPSFHFGHHHHHRRHHHHGVRWGFSFHD